MWYGDLPDLRPESGISDFAPQEKHTKTAVDTRPCRSDLFSGRRKRPVWQVAQRQSCDTASPSNDISTRRIPWKIEKLAAGVRGDSGEEGDWDDGHYGGEGEDGGDGDDSASACASSDHLWPVL